MRKTYELELSTMVRFVPILVLTLFTLGLPLAIAFAGPKAPPLFLLIPLVPFLVWQWWIFLTLAYRVNVDETGRMEWIALARSVHVRPENIDRIGPDRTGNIGFFAITHQDGKIRFINQITGFHEIVNLVKERNPRVELKGC